jgi:hypothetical protein
VAEGLALIGAALFIIAGLGGAARIVHVGNFDAMADHRFVLTAAAAERDGSDRIFLAVGMLLFAVGVVMAMAVS